MKNRVLYGALLILLMGCCVFLSPTTRVLFFAVAGGLCAWEYSTQMERTGVSVSFCVLAFYLILQSVLVLTDAGLPAFGAAFIGSVYLALLAGIVFEKSRGRGALDTVAGLAYPCLLFGVIMFISVSNIWLETLAIACLSTWCCDTAALLGGSRFGKHKLAADISPNKTVEGAVIGLLSAAAVSVLIYYMGVWCADSAWLGSLYKPVPLWLCVVTGLAASTMGQIGDLAESLLKRMLGIKDFSNLIPGHGGMFDRADSLLFSIPTAYFCLRLAGL